MEQVVAKKEDECTIPDERRCTYVFPDGRRCKMRRRWGKEQCYHHDPGAAEQRQQAGRQVSRLRILTATEVQELVSRALDQGTYEARDAGEADEEEDGSDLRS